MAVSQKYPHHRPQPSISLTLIGVFKSLGIFGGGISNNNHCHIPLRIKMIY
jgi:hypothetical protein